MEEERGNEKRLRKAYAAEIKRTEERTWVAKLKSLIHPGGLVGRESQRSKTPNINLPQDAGRRREERAVAGAQHKDSPGRRMWL